MDSEMTRARLAEHTSDGALVELRTQLDLTRVTGVTLGVPDVEGEIKAALRQSLIGVGTPVEALQRLRSRWMSS
jgi:hypothetical protein